MPLQLDLTPAQQLLIILDWWPILALAAQRHLGKLGRLATAVLGCDL